MQLNISPCFVSTDPQVTSLVLVFKLKYSLLGWSTTIHPFGLVLIPPSYADMSLKLKYLAASSHSFLLEIIRSPFDAHVPEFTMANAAVYVKNDK